MIEPPKHHTDPTHGDCLKRNIKAIVHSNEAPSHSGNISPCIRSVHSISSGKHNFMAPAEVWAQTSVVNLLDGNYFQSILPLTNDPDLHFGRSVSISYANITKDNMWSLNSDCCVGETGPWRQNLRTGSACKTDMSGHHVSWGQDTVFHCILKIRQVNSSKNYILAKFTSMLKSR